MDKRYQVFVSSTYADLQDERRKVIQALMEMDCIPAGMELFPAADDEQWEFIKRVIDDCDYYILIIGNRYGSLTNEGISYTEQEFDYAISKGLRVLAFVHGSPDDISVAKSDIDPALRDKLEKFRTKVCQDRLVKFWTTAAELPGLVALSLSKIIKIYPAVGWVRASSVATTEALSDINALTKENTALKSKIVQIEEQQGTSLPSLASLDERFQVTIRWTANNQYGIQRHVRTVDLSWGDLFALIGPGLQEHPADTAVRNELGAAIYRREHNGETHSAAVDKDQFETIRIQLSALGLITANYTKTIQGGMGFFWSLTPKGQKLLVELRTVKSSK